MRAALCGLLLLTGCDSEPPQLKYPGFVLTIDINPALPTLGLAEMSNGICRITLREYPTCLLHEIRHCTEGMWHDERKSDRDCY